MRIRFTKMQGAGNDFVVLDATREPLALGPAQRRRLADRRFGVGADQILVVERSRTPGVDFRYRIFNGASGDEVEHCGNGARCFARYVRERGLIDRDRIAVETVNNQLSLQIEPDGRVTVDMNRPVFEPAQVPFLADGLAPCGPACWPIELDGRTWTGTVLSMGNPHLVLDLAVLGVESVDAVPVASLGPRLETHPRFPRRVNVGFAQTLDRAHLRLRVHERDAGETLACGTGACAAVVAGILAGRLDPRVEVETRGGRLTVAWAGGAAPVLMTGPAETVFEGEVDLPGDPAP